MAPRKKPASKPVRSAAPRGGVFRRILVAMALIGLGLAGGYCWRSFFPIVLPFESPLVADKSSADVETIEIHKAATAALARAEKAEHERDRLRDRIRDLEGAKARTERELGDIKIRDVLHSDGN